MLSPVLCRLVVVCCLSTFMQFRRLRSRRTRCLRRGSSSRASLHHGFEIRSGSRGPA
jgi:hypothetical protein